MICLISDTVVFFINSAGYAVAGLVEDLPLEQYLQNFEVNVFATIGLIQSVLPGMKRKGSGQIINLTSGVGKRALPGLSAYCATKFALNGLTESLRVEVASFGIDVIAFSPGAVATAFHRRMELHWTIEMVFPRVRMRSAEEVAQKIFEAPRWRKREVILLGRGWLGYHLNYWAPALLDRLIGAKYRVRSSVWAVEKLFDS